MGGNLIWCGCKATASSEPRTRNERPEPHPEDGTAWDMDMDNREMAERNKSSKSSDNAGPSLLARMSRRMGKPPSCGAVRKDTTSKLSSLKVPQES